MLAHVNSDIVVKRLNELLKLDSGCTNQLFEQAIDCNDALAKHPKFNLRSEEEGPTPSLGLLDVINALFREVGEFGPVLILGEVRGIVEFVLQERTDNECLMRVSPAILVKWLNELLRLDRSCISQLFTQRIVCNNEVAKSKFAAQFDEKHSKASLGLLGVINGFFCEDDDEAGPICALLDPTQEIVEFQVYDAEVHGVPHESKTSACESTNEGV